MTIPELYIENISLPPAVEAVLDKRTSIGLAGDLGKFTQFSAAEAMTTAANNPAGGGMAAGLGAGMGMAMAGQMTQQGQAGPWGAAQHPAQHPAQAAAPVPLEAGALGSLGSDLPTTCSIISIDGQTIAVENTFVCLVAAAL